MVPNPTPQQAGTAAQTDVRSSRFSMRSSRVDDRIVAVKVSDLGLDGREALLDRCEVVLDLTHVSAYGPKMLESRVFDAFGHGNTPPRRAF